MTYTPTTEEVKESYFDWNGGNEVENPIGLYEEFDRWLAEVKEQEREDCVNHVKFLYCSHSMEYRPYQEAVDDIVEVLTGKEDGSDVFDKWLAEVKAEACTHTFAQQLEEHSLAELIRMAKADAWEEGYAHGNADAFTEARLDRDNPHREHSHTTTHGAFGDPYCATCGIDLEDTK